AVQQVRLDQLFVLVTLEEAQLETCGLGDALRDAGAAIHVWAPIFADDDHPSRAIWPGSERLELRSLLVGDRGVVVVALKEVAIADAAVEIFLPRFTRGKAF